MNELNANFVLQQNFLFRDLPSDTIGRLAALARTRAYTKDQAVFRQGDPGDALYAVITGQVRISTIAADGTELSLNIMEPGDAFGEVALIDGEPRTATATALVPCKLLVIDRDHFMQLLKADSEIAVHLLKLFCARIRYSTEMAEDTAFLSGRLRLAKRLVRLAEDHGTRKEESIVLEISQRELAHFLNISRQLVNQYLGDWSKQGWVEITRGKIVIHDVGSLTGLTQSSSQAPNS
jgi:CRP/FNR family cyclic AMP-dependent transcriptional regulator